MSKYDDYQPVDFNNVTVQWAHVHRPDEYRGSKKFKLEIVFGDDDKEKAASLKDNENFNVREKGGKTILALSKDYDKAKYVDANGNKCIQCVGPDGKTPFTEDIGNGSVINIKATAKKWDVTDKVTLYLEKIQVVNHVAYAGGSGFEDVSGNPF